MKSKAFAVLLLSLITTQASAECQGIAPIQQRLSESEEAAAPIKHESDLVRYLEQLPAQSPLKMLSEDALSSFIASLRFNEKGLTSLSTIELERELTLTQAHDVLGLFGMQRAAAKLPIPAANNQEEDLLRRMQLRCDDHHDGYACAGPGTCKTSSSSICTPSC